MLRFNFVSRRLVKLREAAGSTSFRNRRGKSRLSQWKSSFGAKKTNRDSCTISEQLKVKLIDWSRRQLRCTARQLLVIDQMTSLQWTGQLLSVRGKDMYFWRIWIKVLEIKQYYRNVIKKSKDKVLNMTSWSIQKFEILI